MKILIYLGHPAQYHFFKNIVKKLQMNHDVRYLIKTKEVLESLLKEDNVQYKNILSAGRKDTKVGIVWGLVKRELKVFNEAIQFVPDLMIGGDPSVSHIGKLLKIPVLIVSEDDFNVIKNLASITYPFATHIVTPEVCDCGVWSKKKIGYAGYMKLAYLHPNQFKPAVKGFEPIVIIRTSKLSAYHDQGIKGLTQDMVSRIVKIFNGTHKIFISSEGNLNSIFDKYALKIKPNEFHNLLAKSAMLISDSQSMSMEAAMLGIPSIRYSDFSGKIGVLEELEKNYGLTFGIKTGSPEKLFMRIQELLSISNLSSEFQNRRKKMLRSS